MLEPKPTITHLFKQPQLIDAVAQMIYNEFWVEVVDGMSPADLSAHLHTAVDATRIPLSLIALVNGELVGTVNLIENDDTKRAHLRPWLAAMVVRADRRGQGIGTALVQALLTQISNMKLAQVYLGTDGPGFYQSLGAVVHEQVHANFSIMRFDITSPQS
jgi:predicted N-acetyltransferase YhbS